MPLLKSNPYIDRLSASFHDFNGECFDIVYSLDDEIEVVSNVANLSYKRVVGAVLEGCNLTYTADAADWFNMGLLSKFGKFKADELKKSNVFGHSEIFAKIFQVDSVRPNFYLDSEGESAAKELISSGKTLIGINPYAGGRWPSKEINDTELFNLICEIGRGGVFLNPVVIILFGAGSDRLRNKEMAARIATCSIQQEILVADTDSSLMVLAGYISSLDMLISSDSLALHLGIAQGIPTVAFFAPTSASEIDSFGICKKVVSTSPDYCSYAKNCDNQSITASRIIGAISEFGSQHIIQHKEGG
jgi:heptosyltransferase-2